MLDGLWLGSDGDFAVILQGDYGQATIQYTTLDPGDPGDDMHVDGKVETMIIDRSIMGPIVTQNVGVVENLQLTDSIMDGAISGQAALQLARGEATLNRVTVFGPLAVNRLRTAETLVPGQVDVTDTQTGCFRFSAAPPGATL